MLLQGFCFVLSGTCFPSQLQQHLSVPLRICPQLSWACKSTSHSPCWIDWLTVHPEPSLCLSLPDREVRLEIPILGRFSWVLCPWLLPELASSPMLTSSVTSVLLPTAWTEAVTLTYSVSIPSKAWYLVLYSQVSERSQRESAQIPDRLDIITYWR